MAIKYAWNVKTADTYPIKDSKNDVIYRIHWILTATDDTNKDPDGVNWSAVAIDAQRLNTNNLSNFKKFSDVKTSDVQAWLETRLGAERINTLKASLDAQIAEKITPTSVQKTIS